MSEHLYSDAPLRAFGNDRGAMVLHPSNDTLKVASDLLGLRK